MSEPILNWTQLDEEWNFRHLPERFTALEKTLDDALFKHGDTHGYALLWRWARLSHFRAMQSSENEGENDEVARRHFEAGAQEGIKAVKLQPNRVEGHFWGGVCSLEAVRLGGRIKAALALKGATRHIERAVAIEEEFHFGGPLRVLGRITHLKPMILGGSLDSALDVYRRALQVSPDNSTTLLFYSQALLADQQKPLARQTLNKIVQAPDDLGWMWEQARDRKLAKLELEKMSA